MKTFALALSLFALPLLAAQPAIDFVDPRNPWSFGPTTLHIAGHNFVPPVDCTTPLERQAPS
ncbi:MAG TPA: hypothetical protein VFN10_11245, partial [Thermoanaerobaculia bacterium]|nr:hypothetical protein [Thermoanaerobaculia bacterium]